MVLFVPGAKLQLADYRVDISDARFAATKARELRGLGLIEGEILIVERWSNADRPESELQDLGPCCRPPDADLANRMVASQPDLIFVHASRGRCSSRRLS